MEITLGIVVVLLIILTAFFVWQAHKAELQAKDARALADDAVRQRDQLSAEKSAQATLLGDAKATLAHTEAKLENARAENQTFAASLAAAETQAASLKEKIAFQTAEIENVRNALQRDFKLIAQQIFDDSQKKLAGSNSENLTKALSPLQENLRTFSLRIEEINKTQIEKSSSFETQLKQLTTLNKQMSDDANALTRALKTDNKAAGNWGEMVLQKLLDFSGLTEGREYFTQASTQAEDGSRLRPDVVIALPADKFLIIDSKVSLLSYTALAQAPDEVSAAPHKKAFVESIRRHIDGLAKKKYESLPKFANNPEYVFLFIPIEQAFYALTQADPDIYEYAVQHNIVPVTPATLLPTLKTVEFVWKTEKQNINTMEIAKVGERVHREVKNFVEYFDQIGKAIDNAKKSYTTAQDKLYDAGRNTLVVAAQELEALGVKSQKRMNAQRKTSQAALPQAPTDLAEDTP